MYMYRPTPTYYLRPSIWGPARFNIASPIRQVSHRCHLRAHDASVYQVCTRRETHNYMQNSRILTCRMHILFRPTDASTCTVIDV